MSLPLLAALAVTAVATLLRTRLLRRPLRDWRLLRTAALVAAPGVILFVIVHGTVGPTPARDVVTLVATAVSAATFLAVAASALGQVAPLDRAIREVIDPARRDAAVRVIRAYMVEHYPRNDTRHVVYAGNLLLAASAMNRAGMPREAESLLVELPGWAMDDGQVVVRDFLVLYIAATLAEHDRTRRLLAVFPRKVGEAYLDGMIRLIEARLLVVDGAHRKALAALGEITDAEPSVRSLQLALRAHAHAGLGEEPVARGLIDELARDFRATTTLAPDLLRHPLYFWDGAPATAIAQQVATGGGDGLYR